uniref:SPOR domain-containing protein n=1 Tax=Faecalimicrobium dakarense TaxID=1301100 RepID=UPI0005AAC085
DFTNSVEFGGVITDGNSMVVDSLKKDTINIYFSKDGKFTEDLPNYEIKYRKYPYSMILTFNGVRGMYDTYIEKKVERLPFVKDVYDIMTLDDSQRKFAIEFKENIDFKITEHKNPGMIQVKIKGNKNIEENKVAYFIRTKEFEYGEEIARIEESLLNYSDVDVQKVSNGEYIIQFGPYENKEEANKIIEEVKKDKSIDVDFYLESRNLGQGPKVK